MDEKKFATKEDLHAKHVEVEDYELPSGLWVRLRGLSSFEVHLMRKMAGEDSARQDAVALWMGLVVPKLDDEDDALKWMESRPAGEPTDAVAKIRDLSGLNAEAPKAAYKSVRGESSD